jgi:hypothetical protein
LSFSATLSFAVLELTWGWAGSEVDFAFSEVDDVPFFDGAASGVGGVLLGDDSDWLFGLVGFFTLAEGADAGGDSLDAGEAFEAGCDAGFAGFAPLFSGDGCLEPSGFVSGLLFFGCLLFDITQSLLDSVGLVGKVLRPLQPLKQL